MRAAIVVAAVVLLAAVVAGQTSVDCTGCEMVFGYLAQELPKNTTLAEIVAVWDELCDLVVPSGSSHTSCVAIGVKIAAVAKEVPHYINHDPYNPKVLCSIIELCKVPCCESQAPEQVHVNVGANAGDYFISWAVSAAAPDVHNSSVAIAAQGGAVRHFPANVSTYTRMGWEGRIVVARVTGLAPSTVHTYSVRTGALESAQYSFRTIPAPGKGPTVVAPLIADMGAETYSDQTRASMQKLLLGAGHLDRHLLLLHNGDMSYADGDQHLWDVYMRKMEPLHTAMPLFSVPGNHEIPFDFVSYRLRFPNPSFALSSPGRPLVNEGNQKLYSVVVAGPLRVIGVNTEGVLDTALITDAQLAELEQALTQSDAELDRVPFVVVMGHRPVYCTNHDEMNCVVFAKYLQDRLLPVLQKHTVHMVLEAHQHDYERTIPMVRGDGGFGFHPSGIVYVLNGAAGNREGERGFPQPQPPYVAYTTRTIGFGVIEANATMLEYTQYAAEDLAVLDHFQIPA